jgi:hypothetical protein
MWEMSLQVYQTCLLIFKTFTGLFLSFFLVLGLELSLYPEPFALFYDGFFKIGSW